jgi:hypothetical protein
MKLTSIFMQKMLSRNSGNILLGRNARWLVSTAAVSFGMKYTYNYLQMMQRNYS